MAYCAIEIEVLSFRASYFSWVVLRYKAWARIAQSLKQLAMDWTVR